MRFDLHCHSTASDGSLTPSDLVARAAEREITHLALTDHDTIDGLAEAKVAAAHAGIQLIHGVELSCTWGGATIHVLAYDFSLEDPVLQKALQDLHEGRWQRARMIGDRLAEKGMPSVFEGATALHRSLGDASTAPGRPHFADYLIEAGYVKDRSEAFRKWLGAGKLGDVKQHWPTMEDTLAMLMQSTATVSLAHPWHYDFTRSKRRRLLQAFAEGGGHAVEASNGMQPAEQVGNLCTMAKELGLLVSAGSDFHRPAPWSELGVYRNLPADVSLLSEHLLSSTTA